MRQINFLQPNVKLPFNEVRGSFVRRQQKSVKLVDNLFRDLMPKFRHGQLPFDELCLSVKKVLKGRGQVRVIHSNLDEFQGASGYTTSDYTGNITGQTLELPFGMKKIHYEDLITILHEFQHVADGLYHPKYLACTQLLYQTDIIPCKEYDKYTKNVLYRVEYPKNVRDKLKKLKSFRQKTMEFIANGYPEDQVNILMDSRRFLQMEIQAYKTQFKYAKKLAKKGYEVSIDDLQHCDRILLLQEKLDILSQITADIIKKERAKMK